MVGLYPDVARRLRARSRRCWRAASSRRRSSTSTPATMRDAAAALPERRSPRARRSLVAGRGRRLAAGGRGGPRARCARRSAEGAIGVHAPGRRRARSPRCGAGATASRCAVTARRGGKVSEDIVVPVDRLAEAIDATRRDRRAPRARGAAAGATPATATCTRTFLLDRGDDGRRSSGPSRRRDELFELAVALGGIDLRRARRRLGQERPAARGSGTAAPSSCTGP